MLLTRGHFTGHYEIVVGSRARRTSSATADNRDRSVCSIGGVLNPKHIHIRYVRYGAPAPGYCSLSDGLNLEQFGSEVARPRRKADCCADDVDSRWVLVSLVNGFAVANDRCEVSNDTGSCGAALLCI